MLHPEIEGFTVTAGNSSGINDAAAVVALADPGDHGAATLAKVLSWTSVGVPPMQTGSGPIFAIPKALELAGRKISDVALFEINEAFAAQAVACSVSWALTRTSSTCTARVSVSDIRLRRPGPGW